MGVPRKNVGEFGAFCARQKLLALIQTSVKRGLSVTKQIEVENTTDEAYVATRRICMWSCRC